MLFIVSLVCCCVLCDIVRVMVLRFIIMIFYISSGPQLQGQLAMYKDQRQVDTGSLSCHKKKKRNLPRNTLKAKPDIKYINIHLAWNLLKNKLVLVMILQGI